MKLECSVEELKLLSKTFEIKEKSTNAVTLDDLGDIITSLHLKEEKLRQGIAVSQ